MQILSLPSKWNCYFAGASLLTVQVISAADFTTVLDGERYTPSLPTITPIALPNLFPATICYCIVLTNLLLSIQKPSFLFRTLILTMLHICMLDSVLNAFCGLFVLMTTFWILIAIQKTCTYEVHVKDLSWQIYSPYSIPTCITRYLSPICTTINGMVKQMQI